MAGLLPCLKRRLPTVATLLSTMVEADTPAVQLEAINGLCTLVLVYGQQAVDEAATALSTVLPHGDGAVAGEDAGVDDVVKALERTTLDCGQEGRAAGKGDGAADASVPAAAATEGGASLLPRRSTGLLLVDKLRGIMSSVMAAMSIR